MRPGLPPIARGVVLGLARTATMMQGYGVKFYPPGHRMAGHNERSIAVVMQYVDGKKYVVRPKQLRTAKPILPLLPGHAYSP